MKMKTTWKIKEFEANENMFGDSVYVGDDNVLYMHEMSELDVLKSLMLMEG